jgi:ribosome-binding factor A
VPKEYARKLRINTQIQAELAQLIRTELSDKRVAGVTVTGVDVAPDLRQARVTVSLLGSDEQLKLAVEGLNHASGKLRHGLGDRLKLRTVPNLRFVPDLALREGDRVSGMIRSAVEADRQHAEDRGEKPGEGGGE